MPQRPLVSIIVPVFKAEKFLQQCVESILAQTYKGIELILIDDGSPDECPILCDQFALKDERIRVIHQLNKGVSVARNIGLNNANGAYIAFVDADDWIDSDFIEYMLHQIIELKIAVVACNHFVYVDGKDHVKFPVSNCVRHIKVCEAYENLLYHRPPDVSPWGKLYRREIFSSIKYPEGRIYEDTFLIAEIIDASQGIGFCSRPMYHYRYNICTISKGMFKAQKWDYFWAVEHMIEVIQKPYPFLEKGCIRRRVHAALSIRRLLINSSGSDILERTKCEEIIRSNSVSVLINRMAPLRDKIAILLVMMGPNVFDFAWNMYQRKRSDY